MSPKDSTAATRAALLEAARVEFAAKGVAGARVDTIAERAGVNKERIYGHFGSKEKLFDAVVVTALDQVTEAVSMPGKDAADYVGRLYDYYREHPDLVRLLMWEALHYGGEKLLPGQERRVDKCGRKTVSLAEGLGREPSPQVARTMLMLIGMAMWPTAMPQLNRIFLGADGAADHDAMRDSVLEFVRDALD
ncbi:TetR/AcrR family transcriptional regulator [Microtetraspora malaysiensis]|uniref:TetR/AcrR family transcriptional regulator n=1 Tax=Microtetraspora malaysiensis TaxID=161358 RepID=UPI003D919BBC